jgi:nucleotide-binding universal stress UspA family protein
LAALLVVLLVILEFSFFEESFMKLLVALDGSKASAHALDKALGLSHSDTTEITLLTVIEPLTSYIPEIMMPTGDWVGWRGLPDVELERKLLAAGQNILDQAEALCLEKNIKVSTRLELGLPREVICRIATAEKPDVVILGSRGLGSLERLMLGSVSNYVLHPSEYPVLIVR